MSRPERLHVPYGRYLVVDEFRAGEMLVAAPGRTHTETELRQLTANRTEYETQLTYAVTRWCARVHAHCWLPECALLEIQIGWAPLERVMHSLRGPFSRHVSRITGSPDAVHAGRYKAWLLDPSCAFDVYRELCWRPVRAGLCKHPAEYRYTTIQSAFNGPAPPFLARSEVLAWLRQRRHHPQAQLLSFLSAPPSPVFAALLSGSPHDRRIIGHPDFVRKVHREESRPPPLPHPQRIVEWARPLIEREAAELTQDLPGTPPALLFALTAWLSSCIGPMSVSRLASWFPALDRSQLERAINHHMQAHPNLFSERTLRKFVRHLSSLEHGSPEPSSRAELTAPPQEC